MHPAWIQEVELQLLVLPELSLPSYCGPASIDAVSRSNHITLYERLYRKKCMHSALVAVMRYVGELGT